MAVTHLAYLLPAQSTDATSAPGEADYPLQVARGVLGAAPGRYAITLLSCGAQASEETLEARLTRRILPSDRPTLHPLDALSWELMPALAQVDLVHLFHPYTRFGEFGLLLARLRRLPVCVTVYGQASSKLFTELDLLELADHVILWEERLRALDLHDVYDRMLRGERREAA